MATVEIKIFKHHKKVDGTYNVKIRVTHKRDRRYFDTSHFVSERQLTSNLTVKDAFLKKLLNNQLDDYRATISRLGEKLDFFTAESLANFLQDKNQVIDFIKFSNDHIKYLIKDGRTGSAKTLQTVVFSLNDYFKRKSISPFEINEEMLSKYERFLRNPREITRLNQFNSEVKRETKGLSDSGVHNHLRDLRILFKAAMKFYNKPQIGENPIPYCPFDNYKIVDVPETRKRNLSIQQIMSIRDLKTELGTRAELAKDLFMLSFYLCGMNAVDIYSLTKENISKGRIDYNRTKTRTRRKDSAFISIKLLKPAKHILDKYLGILSLRYSSFNNLDHAINEGLKAVSKSLKLPSITFYWARHSFGTIARNKCRMSKDDVALALNHIDNAHKTTDIYIEKDWSIVDDVQKAVLSLLTTNQNLTISESKKCNQVAVTTILNFVVLKTLTRN